MATDTLIVLKPCLSAIMMLVLITVVYELIVEHLEGFRKTEVYKYRNGRRKGYYKCTLTARLHPKRQEICGTIRLTVKDKGKISVQTTFSTTTTIAPMDMMEAYEDALRMTIYQKIPSSSYWLPGLCYSVMHKVTPALDEAFRGWVGEVLFPSHPKAAHNYLGNLSIF